MIINRLWLVFLNNNATFANVESELDCSVLQIKLTKRRRLGAHKSSKIAFFFQYIAVLFISTISENHNITSLDRVFNNVSKSYTGLP